MIAIPQKYKEIKMVKSLSKLNKPERKQCNAVGK